MIAYELKKRRKSILVWAIVLVSFTFLGMTDYTATTRGMDLNAIMEAMPKIMQTIYGTEGLNLSSFTGYFTLLLFYTLLMVACQGISLGSSLVEGEIRENTTEFLYTKPFSRKKILWNKFLAGLIIVVILEVIYAIVCAVLFFKYQRGQWLANTILAAFTTHLFFYILGFGLTLVLKKKGRGQLVGFLYVLFAYFSLIFASLYEKPLMNALSPIGIYRTTTYEATFWQHLPVALLLLLSACLILQAGLLVFQQRDLPV